LAGAGDAIARYRHAISAGQDLHPFNARLAYGPNFILLDRLKIGQPMA